jgi:hypothetical protein
MAAKKKSMKARKASRGKTGCLKQNGQLKKGWKRVKGRKGFCQPVPPKTAKKGAAKKRAPKRKSPTLPKGMDVMDYLDVGGKVRAAYEAKKAGFVNPGAGI